MATNETRTARVGDRVGGTYVLRGALGAGGMGVVFEAENGRGDTVAIKLPHPDRVDPMVAQRFRSEAIAARYAAHANVVSVLDFSAPDESTPFIVMEKVRGLSLGTMLRRWNALPLLRSADIAGQILAGLAATHAAGVVHADIKSDNILVQPRRDGSDAVKIIDFGLASVHRVDHVSPVLDHDDTGRLLMSGTPAYMAPEVIRGEGAIAASDIYAAGVVLYEMITGTTPFDGPPARILDCHLHEEVRRPSLRRPDRFIPSALEAAVMTALEKQPARRHASASAFAAAIVAATPAAEPSPISRYRHAIVSSSPSMRDTQLAGATLA